MANYMYYDYQVSKICMVKEDVKSYHKYNTILHYLNEQCLQNGSNYQGRKESFQYLTKQKKFIPIVISIYPLCIYFPTDSLKEAKCKWINYAQIQSIQYKEKECTIYFKDHTSLTCYHPKRIENSILHIKRYLLLKTNYSYNQINKMNNFDYNLPFHNEEY